MYRDTHVLLLLVCGVCTLFIQKGSTSEVCDEDVGEFYSKLHHKCIACDTCQEGFGRDLNTVVQRNKDGQPLECYRCAECLKGSHSLGGDCIPCRLCSDLKRHDQHPCTSAQNAVCGKCFQKFYDFYKIEEGFADVIKPCRDCVFDRNGVPECTHSHPLNPSKLHTGMIAGIVVAVVVAAIIIVAAVGVVVYRRCPVGRNGRNQIVISESGDTNRSGDIQDNCIKDTQPLLSSSAVEASLPAVTMGDDRTLAVFGEVTGDGDRGVQSAPNHDPLVMDPDMESMGQEPETEELPFGEPDLEEDGLFVSGELDPHTLVHSDDTFLKSLVPATSLDGLGLSSSDQEMNGQALYLPKDLDTSMNGCTNYSLQLTQQNSSPWAAQAELVVTLRQLDEVAKKLSINQSGRLLRRLGLSNADTTLDNLKDQYDSQELVYQSLRRWKQEFGNFATLNKMIDALKDIGRKDIADTL